MKKTVMLFCLFIGFIQISFSQNTFFQVKLNQDYHQVVQPGDIYLNQINDNGFNQIINNQGGYIQPIQIGYRFSDELFLDFIGIRLYPSMVSNTANLYNQLLGYTTIVSTIYYNTAQTGFPDTIYGVAADRLKMVLANSTDGSYQSTIGNIVQTNNSQLNTIFQNFNVDKYEGQYIRCNCNVSNLKTALQNLSVVVSNVFDVQITGVYLNNPEFILTSTNVYPNPFDSNLVIESGNEIKNYLIYDNNGRKIIETTSKNDFNLKSQNLGSGIYFLNLFFEDGQKEIKKIIKN